MTITLILFACFSILAVVACGSAYRNGVTDGYGYAKEPHNPGYQKAGEYLRGTMAHRWPGLQLAWPTQCIHGNPVSDTAWCEQCRNSSLGGRLENAPMPTELELDSILMRRPNGGLE